MRMSNFGGGIAAVAGIGAVLYISERGYEWWQVLLMALFVLLAIPGSPKVDLSFGTKEDD